MKRWLPTFAWDRPITVLMAFCGLVLLGVISYVKVPIQLFPAGFETKQLWVGVAYPNASSKDVDREIVSVVQEQLLTVPGVESFESTARSDQASFAMSFYGSQDMGDSYNTVVDRMERAMVDLPDDVEDYWVYKFSPDNAPILWLGVTLPDEIDDAQYILDKIIRPKIERIPGVAGLDVWGTNQRAVYIDYDRERVMSHGIDLSDLSSRLRADNFQLSGGVLRDEGSIRYVRSLSQFETINTIANYPVKDDLQLRDVADVSMRLVSEGSINRLNGRNAVGIGVQKESSANTVEVCRRVDEVLKELEANPKVLGMSFYPFFSQGELITESVDNLTNTALLGGLFAIVVLYIFLREWRMTLLIAGAIPFSLLITVSIQYLRGESLNVLTLMGLMLAVGMAVDNAIVVVETIYRKRSKGAGVRESTIEGTAEVNLAITTSTATTMVVFLPIMLMTEQVEFAFFLRVLGFAVVFTLGASLVVALVFVPFATRYMRGGEVRPDPRWLVSLTARYRRALSWVLSHRADAAVGLAAMAILTIMLPLKSIECTAESEGGGDEFMAWFSVPKAYGPGERDALVASLEEVVEDHSDEWGVRAFRTRLGVDSTGGRMWVYLDPNGPLETTEVIDRVKNEMPTEIPGVRVQIGWDDEGSRSASLPLTVHGENVDVLDELADEIIRRTEMQPSVMSVVQNSDVQGAEEIRLHIDREAVARSGLTAMSVAQTVSYAMRGTRLEPLIEGEKEIDVISRFGVDDRESLSKLEDFGVWAPGAGALIPVGALTRSEIGRGPYSIHRQDRVAGLRLTVNFDPDSDFGARASAVDAAIGDMVLPPGYSWSQGRGFGWEEQEMDAQVLALVLSIVFVFLLMGMLFESVVLPLSVMTTVPMAAVGALWGLYLTDTQLDTMAGVGLVILVGVVVNNGIVLIDLVTQLRAEGMPRTEALLEAGTRRLRPILMTALTTICGLVPMAIGSSSFVGIPYAPLGRVVIGGLMSATILTIFFVPYLYAFLDDARDAGYGWLGYVLKTRSTR